MVIRFKPLKLELALCEMFEPTYWYWCPKEVFLFGLSRYVKSMKVIRDLKNFASTKKTVLTIGTFDGVHIGHQKIIQQLVAVAKAQNLESVVLTFFPHPRMVLQNENAVQMIDSMEEKIHGLEQLGVDILVIHPFSLSFSRTTAVSFARDTIATQLNCQHVIIGYDHRFGQNREATIKDLEQFGEVYDFQVTVIPVQDIESIAVSSTKIRKAIVSGDLPSAQRYLNRPFRLAGTVVQGERVGKTIGFPTANLKIEEIYKLQPPKGVYLVNSAIDKHLYWGMMNIGNRPTFEGKKITVEVHFFDLNQDLYQRKISLNLFEKIREEKKFDSQESLQEQLKKDKLHCVRIIDEIPNRTTTFAKN